jgi:hypothetical protein
MELYLHVPLRLHELMQSNTWASLHLSTSKLYLSFLACVKIVYDLLLLTFNCSKIS